MLFAAHLLNLSKGYKGVHRLQDMLCCLSRLADPTRGRGPPLWAGIPSTPCLPQLLHLDCLPHAHTQTGDGSSSSWWSRLLVDRQISCLNTAFEACALNLQQGLEQQQWQGMCLTGRKHLGWAGVGSVMVSRSRRTRPKTSHESAMFETAHGTAESGDKETLKGSVG